MCVCMMVVVDMSIRIEHNSVHFLYQPFYTHLRLTLSFDFQYAIRSQSVSKANIVMNTNLLAMDVNNDCYITFYGFAKQSNCVWVC